MKFIDFAKRFDDEESCERNLKDARDGATNVTNHLIISHKIQ